MVIIAGECEDDFEGLRADLMEEHDPQSALECELVERMSGILWRLRRVPPFEASILDACRAEMEDWPLPISRYESEETDASVRFGNGLISAFTKTLQMLLPLQHHRGSNRCDAANLEAASGTEARLRNFVEDEVFIAHGDGSWITSSSGRALRSFSAPQPPGLLPPHFPPPLPIGHRQTAESPV
jgi:hypothetical protein